MNTWLARRKTTKESPLQVPESRAESQSARQRASQRASPATISHWQLGHQVAGQVYLLRQFYTVYQLRGFYIVYQPREGPTNLPTVLWG